MKNEAFLNGLLGVIKQPVFAKNENFLYTYCNQAFADYLGKTVHEIIGHNVFQLFTAENAEIYHQSDQQLFESGGTQQYETIISSLDGTEHHSIIYKNIITDDKDSKIGIIGLIEDVTELKEKEKKLYETESKYKKFFENVQDIFYQVDLNGIIIDISPSVSKYSDYTRKEIIGQPIDFFYANPEDRNNLLIEIQKKGEALDFEVQLKGKNNRLTFASVNAHFICDENGQVSGLEGTLRDLTERKLAEEKWKLSLSLLQATLDSTTDGILVVDTSGKITSYNNQFKVIFDVPEEILESGNDTIALESVLNKLKDPNQFINKVQLLYQHPEMDSFDAIEFSDGRIIERFSCPQRLDGKPIGRVWNFRDVSVREKAGQQLQLMAHTLESINECISITDTEDRILFINEAFLKTYGFSQEELIGQHISIVRSPNNDPEIINKIIKVTTNTGWKGEILNRRKDGSDFPISLSTSVVQNEKGEILGMVGVAIDVSERKKEELELKESEERYRSFFEGSPDAIFLADLETGILIDANPAASILLKKPLSEIIGMHHTNLHPKSAEDFSRKSLQSVSIREQQKNLRKPTEKLVVCSNGTEVPVEIMANTIHIKGRSVIQGIFRDISERKLAESAIHESEKRFRLLIETQGEGVSIVDQEENLLFVNPTAEEIFGVAPGSLIHRNLKEFIVPEQFERVLQESQKRANKEKSTYEIDIITPGGIRKNILVTATPQIDDVGKQTGTLGIFRDITDRKQAEEMLRQSEIKYRNLIETMPDGVYRSTHEGKFVEVNPAMVKMLGYENKEDLMAIDIKSQLYFAPEDHESLVLDNSPKGLEVFSMKKKDGSTVWIEDHGWYLKNDEGQILFHEGILRDVTERKMTEIQLQKYSEELQELNATKDKFFSIIAHDLKNPFSSIVGFSEILKDEAKHLDIETIEQYAEILYSTSKNTYRLLENLLDWARVQQLGMPFRPGSIILKTIVSEVAELMVEKANSKSITIINHIPDNLIVRADEDMLKTILRNLVSNALKYTSANGTVEIKTVSLADGIEITVKDTGTGIKKEDIGKIFKVGSNYSRRGTENEIGTGLGLLLCKEFVIKHGGKIWVESEEGKGSEFKFILPLS